MFFLFRVLSFDAFVVVRLLLDRGVIAGGEDPDTQDSPAYGSEEDLRAPESTDEDEGTSDAVVVHDPSQALETSFEDNIGLVDLHTSRTLDLNLHGIRHVSPSFCEGYAIEDRDLKSLCFKPPSQDQPVQLGSLTSEVDDRRVVRQDSSSS